MSVVNPTRPWYLEITRRGRLRTKFLLSLLLVSASLTCSTLLVVRHRVEVQARDQIREALQNSVVTFQHIQRQRENALDQSAALVANEPSLKALMSSHDKATIEDGSQDWFKILRTGSDLFALADSGGTLMALRSAAPGLTQSEAQRLLGESIRSGTTRGWWLGGGRLFRVSMWPIYFGDPANGTQLGVLVVGYEISDQVAADIGRVASSEVAFRYGSSTVVTTLKPGQRDDLARKLSWQALGAGASPVDVELGGERFLATSTNLAPGSSPAVGLIVLKSYDQATAFLRSLNRWLLGLGLVAILAGSILVFLISDTFTRPLANLVGGVQALERGDFDYPLEPHGNDEVSALTQSFDRMRRTLQSAQEELLQAERLATIGRMASTISHDLRHSLTTILAYAEFLSEGTLRESRRVEYYQEIRKAVNQMTDQIQALLEFSRAKAVYRPAPGNIAEVIERAVHAVKARPEFSGVQVSTSFEGSTEGRFDAGSLERVFHNLVLNACEAVPENSGRIEVTTRQTAEGMEVRVADNGMGIPEEIRNRVFQPFVTAGKDNGIGLGLAVVHKIVQDHGGQVGVEYTGSDGTVLRISLPSTPEVSGVRRGGAA
jgi:signal transduction histidine kinase